MNTTNTTSQLEKDLRSFGLRQPSEKVKQRLFQASRTEGFALPTWGWLAPITACFFVTLAVLSDHNTLPAKGDKDHAMTLATSNQSYAVSAPGSFGWTKEAGITSIVDSPLTLATNH